MPARHYHNRRRNRPWGRNATLEMVITGAVIVLLVALLVVFLFVYHDLPLRVSGP
jgi:heme/copper-type cytochrome/quinol oxidase subunit 2